MQLENFNWSRSRVSFKAENQLSTLVLKIALFIALKAQQAEQSQDCQTFPFLSNFLACFHLAASELWFEAQFLGLKSIKFYVVSKAFDSLLTRNEWSTHRHSDTHTHTKTNKCNIHSHLNESSPLTTNHLFIVNFDECFEWFQKWPNIKVAQNHLFPIFLHNHFQNSE